MNNSWKRFLSLLLAMVMVLSLGVTGFADEGEAQETPAEIAEGSIASTEEADGEDPAEDPAEETLPGDGELEMEEISPDKVHVRKLGLEEEEDLGEIVPMDGEDLDTVVRASIFLNSPSTLAAGYSAKGVGTNADAIAYRDGLKAEQDAMTAQIESVIGHELNVHWNMTLAMNAISADLSLGEMVKVKEIPGVRSVQRENQYLPMDEGSISEPDTASTSENMVGATAAWAAGFTGAGSRIAIIDTGIDTGHQSFAEDAFTYSVEKAGATGELMTEAEVRSLASQLNSKSNNYVSAKIPYGYNYVDGTTTITHTANGDVEGNHGSHVAGIAAANRYIKSGSSYVEAADQVGAVGMAPDAQLLVMKVFGVSGGAYDSDYMVAIEDAMVLGADVCNLSLGSGAPGWSFDNSYQSYLNGWADGSHNDEMVLTISAGNSYSATDYAPSGATYIEDAYTHTGGSPGSFVNSLCVASAQNTLTTGTPMQFNGDLDVFYYESTGNEEEGTTYTNPELITIVGSYQYVYIDSVGSPEDFSKVNAAVNLSGKVVIVNRGDLSFVEKGENAKSYNPKAVIIANNKAGTIHMDLTDFTGTFPMVTITLDDALKIKAGAGSQSTASGVTYYTGSMKVTNTEKSVVIDRSEATINDFSSWGVPGSLLMKPEITAPGGDIYSVNGTANTSGGTTGGADQYVSYSGTSMAAPHMAGLSAILAERIREQDIRSLNAGLSGYSIRAIAQSLLMSTATPMAPKNNYLPILQQGAGLADVSLATTANSIIMMDPANSGLTGLTGAAADGKVKVELGDDPDRAGDYSFGFTVYNLTQDDMVFDVDTDVFTQASDGEFMLRSTAMLGASATFWWQPLDGASVPNEHDVNKDGRTDKDDAQAILDFLSGEVEETELNLAVADLDEDTNITTQDAYQLLGFVSEQGSDTQDGLVPAGGSRYCAVRIRLPEALKDSMNAEYPGGAFIEGFTYLTSVGTTKDGAVYTDEHSIPILGYYGSWTDAAMFETTSYTEALYGSEQLPYSGTSDTNYMKLQMNGSSVKFSGNPYMVEAQFPADRLAINSNTTMQSIAYNLIRSAGTTGFAVSRLSDGQVSEVLHSSIAGNEVTGQWFYVNQNSWQNTSTRYYAINKTPASCGLAENDTFRVGFYAIPEYNAMLVNKSYDAGNSGILSQEGFNSLLTSNVLGKGAFVGYDFVVDNTEPVITDASLNGSTLTVSAEDNRALAYLAVLSLDGETVYIEAAPGISNAELSFDASEAIANAHGYVAVFAGDYAGNEAAMAVKVNDNTVEEKTVYVLTDTLTAGEEYLIVSGNTTGLALALGHTGETAGTNEVTVRAGIEETGSQAYINSTDVANTSVWTVSNGYTFANNGYYLRQNRGALSISTNNSNNSWSWDGSNSRLSINYNNTSRYLRFANGSFSLSTAANSVYLFQKTVIRTEVDPYTVLSVTVTPDSLDLYKGNTADLSAKVQPLTAGDRSVTWTSSDPNVATVDEAGRVTAVGAGVATITATANSDIEKKGECAVKVTSIDKALNGIVWDEEGGVYFSSFNTDNLPTWTKRHQDNKQLQLLSAFQNTASALYASTIDMNAQSSEIYSVNRSTYALTDYGTNYVMAFGTARAPSSNYFIYGFAKYLILGNLAPETDPDEGTFSGFPYGMLDTSSALGDAYVSAVCVGGKITSSEAKYYILDESGKIWETTLKYNSLSLNTKWSFSTPTLVVDTGIPAGLLYQSIYYDGSYLYWSHQTDNETELIIILPSTKQVYNAGNFGEGVWPVGGLYVDGSAAPADLGDEPMGEDLGMERVATYADLMTADVIERLTYEFSRYGVDVDIPLPETGEDQTPADEGSIEDGGTIAPVDEPVIEPVPAEDGQNSAYIGGLTAFRGAVSAAPRINAAEPLAADDTIAVEVTEIEASHNGLIAVSFDPALVSLESWTDSKKASNLSVHVDDKGVVTIAYANKDADGDDIAQGDAIVTLNFSVANESALECGEIATLITLERNSKLELDEQTDAILPGNPGHEWGEPTWVWADDFASADAEFVCKNDPDHKATVAATLTEETVDGVTTYTAAAVFQGKTYTDTRTKGETIELSFTHSISLGNNLTIYYFVPASYLEGYENVRLHAERNKYNGDGSSFHVEEYEITDYEIDARNRYKFAFSNIAAKEIGDDVLVKVLADKDGVTYSSKVDTYSVKTYAMNQLAKSSSTASLKTLMVDLLNYGAAAQTYFTYRTNSMANADLTAEQQALGTTELGTLNSCEATVETPGATAHFSSKSVVLDSEIVIKYYITFDEGQSLDNVRAEITYETAVGTPTTVSFDASEFEYEADRDRYALRLRTVAVKDAARPVTAKIYDGDTLISDVFTYSIETYAYNQLNKPELGARPRAIITAMMIFCKSAESYFTNN